MIHIPEQYKETIHQFILAYYNRRRWEIEQAFIGIQVPMATEDLLYLLYNSALADQLAEIARAAAGKMEHSEDGWAEGVLMEGIQDLMERLFAPPGLGSAYDIPARFWETDLGQMVSRAMVWARRDELISVSEAAELRGVTIQAITNAVREGRLRRHINQDVVNPQHRTLVSRADVEAMD